MSMWRRLLQRIADRRPTKTYHVDEEVLFYRSFLMQIGSWVLFLHHYVASDPDRGLHNHPARCVGLILAGGYDEEFFRGLSAEGMVTGYRRLRLGRVFWTDEYRMHRVCLRRNRQTRGWPEMVTSWSLFLVRYLDKPWGIMSRDPLVVTPAGGPEFIAYTYRERGRGGIYDDEGMWWEEAAR